MITGPYTLWSWHWALGVVCVVVFEVRVPAETVVLVICVPGAALSRLASDTIRNTPRNPYMNLTNSILQDGVGFKDSAVSDYRNDIMRRD